MTGIRAPIGLLILTLTNSKTGQLSARSTGWMGSQPFLRCGNRAPL